MNKKSIENDFQIITLDEIMQKIKEKINNNYEMVISIARGGILPGYLISRYLNIPLEIIYINLRDENHNQIFEEPQLLKDINFEINCDKILLVDDVSNSGKTLKKAKSLIEKISNKNINWTTLVISGNADISLFGPHNKCIKWPWI